MVIQNMKKVRVGEVAILSWSGLASWKVAFVPSSEGGETGSEDGPWKCSRPKEQQMQSQAETMPDLKGSKQAMEQETCPLSLIANAP